MTSVQHIEYFNFRCKVQLDIPVARPRHPAGEDGPGGAVLVRPLDLGDGLAGVRPVRRVGRLERLRAAPLRGPDDVGAVVVRRHELAAVVAPRQRLELLRRHVRLQRRLRLAVPQDDQAPRVADEEAAELVWLHQKGLHGAGVHLEVLGRPLHGLVLGCYSVMS